jgi:hypothetical protein
VTRATVQRFAVRLLFYGAAAAAVVFILSARPGIQTTSRATFPAMLTGDADRPFVTRVLMPATVRTAAALLPPPARTKISELFHGRYADFPRLFGWEDAWLVERAVATLVILVCLTAFAFALRLLVLASLPVSPLVADVTPLGVLALLPLTFRYVGYLYDPATLLLSALALLFLFRRRFGMFWLVLIPAVLNKETSVVLIGAFAMVAREVFDRRRLVLHVSAQLIFWLAVRVAINGAFARNGGAIAEFHLIDHTFGYARNPAPFFYLLLTGSFFGWLVGSGWNTKPLMVRRVFLVTAVPLLVTAPVFGYLDELRQFYDAVPAAALLGVMTVTRLLGTAEPGRVERKQTQDAGVPF